MDFGKALQGIGMGMSGQGAQWAKIQQDERLMQQQQQEQEKARQQQIIEQRRKAMAEDARIGRMHLERGNLDAFNQLAQNRIGLIEGAGADPSDTIMLMERVNAGDVDGAIKDLKALEYEAVVRGYLPEVKAPEPDKRLLEIQKETRNDLRKSFSKISDEVKAIKTNYGKIEALSKEVSKDNRTAVAQLMTALVKLGDPGSIVNTAEMENALNSQNPVAYLASKGVDSSIIDNIMQKIDPLNPGNVNIGDVKATARALVASNVPDLMSRYDMELKRGKENLSEDGYKSIYSDVLDKRVKSLNELLPKEDEGPVLVHPQYGEIMEDDIRQTMRDNNMTRAQVLQKLGVK